jgi:hypothetical protein
LNNVSQALALQAPDRLGVSMTNKSRKLLPFIVIFIALAFRNFQNGDFDPASVYFVGLLSGGALSLSAYGLIMHLQKNGFRAVQ